MEIKEFERFETACQCEGSERLVIYCNNKIKNRAEKIKNKKKERFLTLGGGNGKMKKEWAGGFR